MHMCIRVPAIYIPSADDLKHLQSLLCLLLCFDQLMLLQLLLAASTSKAVKQPPSVKLMVLDSA